MVPGLRMGQGMGCDTQLGAQEVGEKKRKVLAEIPARPLAPPQSQMPVPGCGSVDLNATAIGYGHEPTGERGGTDPQSPKVPDYP